MRSPGPLFIVSSRGPRSNTFTASPSPVRATTSTAAFDLPHFHNYCYAERNRNTFACYVHNHVNVSVLPDKCCHECQHNTYEYVRHTHARTYQVAWANIQNLFMSGSPGEPLGLTDGLRTGQGDAR